MQSKYSICMCNYNMQDTLELSLVSILEQLNSSFEVLVVDDGSSDNSVVVIKKLQNKYKSLRLVELCRDPNRKLGYTRNISVQEAKGKYVLLQLDCDDVYDQYIIDFVKVFHQIEKCMDRDFYLKGQKINIGKRSFLLKHGPYQNIFRGEDRDMWIRMASINAFIPLKHKNFFKRLPKSKYNLAKRAIIHTWDHLQNDFRMGGKLIWFYINQFYSRKRFTIKAKLLRATLAPFAWLGAKLKEPIIRPNSDFNASDFNAYVRKEAGTLSEIMNRNDCEPDYEQLSEGAREIFG